MRWIQRVAVLQAKDDPFASADPVRAEWFRRYQCAAYNAVCAIACNTKTNLRQYEYLLFHNANIWAKLINIVDDRLYTAQPLDVAAIPKIRQRITSIRRQGAAPSQLVRKYIDSQAIFDSSLSQDVLKIDLSSSFVRQVSAAAAAAAAHDQPHRFALQSTAINEHEVMAALCASIEHMFATDITPYNHDGRPRAGSPVWIETICRTIESDQTPKNVRLFLAVVVDNLHERFAHYSIRATRAILKFLAAWQCDQIDAITIFLCADLLEWDAKYRIQTDDEIRLANQVLEKLMARAWNEHKDVFRRHLEVIRHLMEKWRDMVTVPTALLFDAIRVSDDPKSKRHVCGIHLNGIVLSNGLVPWGEDGRVEYLHALCACLDNEHAAVYQPAAQVLGMALQEIVVRQQSGDDSTERFLDMLNTKLTRFLAKNESKFLNVLYGMHKYYEPIVDRRFLVRIAAQIPRSCAKPKRCYLEMFQARVNVHGDQIFKELLAIKILELLQSDEFGLIALHIVNKSLPNMSADELKRIAPALSTLQQTASAERRQVVYEIWIYVRQNHAADHVLHELATPALLSGLNDSDTNVRNRIYQYWTATERLPDKIHLRLLYIFERLYHPQCQNEFVKYCVQFLLEPALQANGSKEVLNILQHHVTGNFKLTEYDVDVASTMQNSSLQIPLFAEAEHAPTVSGTPPYLKSTENALHFDPTQDPATLYHSNDSFSLETYNSLLFSVPAQALDRRSQRTGGRGPTANRSDSSQFQHLRTYVVRGAHGHIENAFNAAKRSEFRRVVAEQQAKEKSGHVQLFRRYRFGHSPDFFLNSLAFLLPLQSLIRHDGSMARSTFVALFTAIFNEIDEPHRPAFVQQLGTVITAMLAKSESCDPMLFSVLTELTMTHGVSFGVESKFVGSLSKANDMTVDGILFYEHRLIAAAGATAANAADWANLANLYSKLNETEIVASIFAHKMAANPLLTDAINCTADREYVKAVRMLADFTELDTITPLESDFAYQSFFNCFAEMARWEDLEKEVRKQIESEEELWTDNWNMRNLLPHYMQANAHLAVRGAHQSAKTFTQKTEMWLRDAQRCGFIERHFSEPLMLLFVANDDFLRAKFYSDRYFEHFLDGWRHISVLSRNLRNDKLLNVRCVAEMHEYAAQLGGHIDEHVLFRLSERWKCARLQQTDSIHTWETLIGYRTFVTDKMLSKCQSQDVLLNSQLTEHMLDMHFKLNEVAIQQRNIDLSNTVLRRIKALMPVYGTASARLAVQLDVASEKCAYANTIRASMNSVERPTRLVAHWERLCDIQAHNQDTLAQQPSINLDINIQIGDIVQRIVQVDVNSLSDALKEKILHLTGQHDRK